MLLPPVEVPALVLVIVNTVAPSLVIEPRPVPLVALAKVIPRVARVLSAKSPAPATEVELAAVYPVEAMLLPPVVVPVFAPVNVNSPVAPVIEPVPVTLVALAKVIPRVERV